MSEIRVELIDVNKIIPSPYRVRETVDEESLKELAKTIKEIGLLQPISVRPKGDKYEIIQGERRWRAAKIAGLKRIPAIVKHVDDRRLLIEALVENVHRQNLTPIEEARALAEVYRLHGFDVLKARKILSVLSRWAKNGLKRELTEEERKVKEIADMIGLSYGYQYKLLTQLRLTPEEQKRAIELGLEVEKTIAIATIESKEIREKILEIAPELSREEVRKISSIVKKAPKSVTKMLLEGKIKPEIAELVLRLPEPEQIEVIKHIVELRLTPEEAKAYIEARMEQLPMPPPEELTKIKQRYEQLQQEIKAKLETPEAKKRGALFKNWAGHLAILGTLESVFCPICGSRELGWICCKLGIKEAAKEVERKYQESLGGR